ncbi:VCBS repeat-containing protein [Zunongwangia endophytica]|uniref:VCBS repeat-containing protein n=1 Tax=Zunongwangia endophytica TaxID=1808945 RepID=A0ABV8HEX1_9FLAO|nr:VCBS repeat-containing protein [Zunongwangia endophytica]MDN3593818.1 VCBS repeat-containing protein [Zunongwangia endophytica]
MNKFSAILSLCFNRYIGIVILLSFLYGCNKDSKKQYKEPNDFLFTAMPKDSTGISFINQVKNEKDFNIFRYRNFYNGAGVGIGDINNDGLPDVYLTSNMGKNKLYLNQGDFKFKDISETSATQGNRSWSTGVTMVDINSDGLLDIYVCNAGNIEGEDRRNELYINNGDLTFTEKASEYNLNENGFTTHAAFFDYDLDGDLDVYILNNSFIPASSLGYNNKRELRSKDWNLPEVFKGGGDKLLRNDNGKFKDVSEEAGIYGSLIGFGLGVTIGDVNNDMLPDIYVSNDFYERDYLYINEGNGTFNEGIKNRISHLSMFSMGADIADINNDGLPEIFVTDMLPKNDERIKNTTEFERFDLYKLKQDRDFYHQFMQNSLQLNTGNNSFSEIAFYSDVAQTDWSWGALIFDMDNDGYKDIYVSNGIYHDLTNQDFMDFFANDILQDMVLTGQKKEFDSILNEMPSTAIPNFAFKNNADLSFSNTTEDWGFDTPSFSNGSAYGDLDNDGDLDLIVNNVNMELFVYRNETNKKRDHNWTKIELKGNDKNTFAIGSKVVVYTEDNQFTQQLIPTRGFQSSTDYNLTFGIGAQEKIDSIRITWPDKMASLKTNVEINTLLVFDQTEAEEFSLSKINYNQYFKEIDTDFTAHKEDNYIDYDYEGLINKMLSREGPAIAVADVNNDGNDDFYMAGARNQSGVLYIQQSNGRFLQTILDNTEESKVFEETGAIFLDINNDDFEDLIIISGGNTIYADKAQYETRIYLNDGNGKFSEENSALPINDQNAAVIAANDFDNDRITDLFIGYRSVPGVYGINPMHQLLKNNGNGQFTALDTSNLDNLGMITDASWVDINNNGTAELIVTGDWKAPAIFKVQNKKLTQISSNLSEYAGAWNSMKVADLNKDGLPDLILGNRGTNSFYNASKKKPVKVYISDFDDNGTTEQIFTRPINGKDVPIHLRRELSGQISSVKKQNLKFAEYATKSIDQLFSKEVLAQALVKEISSFKSVIAINKGDGNFDIKEMPPMAQFSSIHAIEVIDVNNDENSDIIIAGNDYDLKPQFSRLDSNYGLVLVNDGKGNFKAETSEKTGLFFKGQVRDLKIIQNKKGENLLLVGINNEKPKLYKLQ